MKINDHHYKYTVRNAHQIRRNVRNMVERAMSNAGTTYTLTLENVAKTREMTINLVWENDNVTITLPDGKVVHSKREVYLLLKEVLQFQ